MLRDGGFTLIEALITVAVLAAAGTALVQLSVNGMKANKSTELRSDLQDIKRTIVKKINCEQSLGSFGSDRPISCASGTTVELKDKGGNSITPNGRIGDWNISAKCEEISGANGLSIIATKKHANGTFKLDPLTNVPFDESNPVSRLFKNDVRLCGDYFESAGDDGWIPFPAFAYYTSATLPPATTLPGNPVFTIRFGVTTSAASRSPTDYCKSKGYRHSLGTCKCNSAHSLAAFSMEGSLLANSAVGNWAYACVFGEPQYVWADNSSCQLLCM